MTDDVVPAPSYPDVAGELTITSTFVGLVVEEAQRRGYEPIDPTVAGFVFQAFMDAFFAGPTAAAVVELYLDEGIARHDTAVFLADCVESANAATSTRPRRLH